MGDWSGLADKETCDVVAAEFHELARKWLESYRQLASEGRADEPGSAEFQRVTLVWMWSLWEGSRIRDAQIALINNPAFTP
jgi:hypothetical protein